MVTETDPRPLSREELSKFLPSKRAIRAFERIFELIPTDLLSLESEIEILKVVADLAYAKTEELSQDVSELGNFKVEPKYETVNDITIAVQNEIQNLNGDVTPPWLEVIEHVDLGLDFNKDMENFDLSPREELGTLASQDKDLVDVTGGTIDADLTDNTTDLLKSSSTLSDNSGVGAGTLSNAPTAGDPSKWIAIDDNGTTRYIPTWT